MSANEVQIFVPKYGQRLGQGFTKSEVLDSFIHPGRRTKANGYQSPASWITELADTRKAIQLCNVCASHFNPKRNHFRVRYVPDSSGATSGYVCNGQCDGCKERTENMGGGKLFLPEELWEAVSNDPQEARIRARMAWGKPKTNWRSKLFGRR